MVLSSNREAIIYLSSQPGIEGVRFGREAIRLENVGLNDGDYIVDIWKPAHPGGIVKTDSARAVSGRLSMTLPEFVDDIDDIVVHIRIE